MIDDESPAQAGTRRAFGTAVDQAVMEALGRMTQETLANLRKA